MSRSKAGPEPGESRRILIVEDEFLLAMALEQALDAAGFRVVGIAGDGPTALALAEAGRPDLVVTDVKLRGGSDGVATAVAIRERFGAPPIFVSGNLDAWTRARAARAVPAGFIDKPYTEAQLIRAVRDAFAGLDDRVRVSEPAMQA